MEKLLKIRCFKFWICLLFLGNLEISAAVSCNLIGSAPTHGSVSCTNANNYDSVCTYTCNEGYALSNDSLAITTCNDYGVWSSEAPECSVFLVTPMVDLVFVLDGSGSVSRSDFSSMLEWTKSVGNNLIRSIGDNLRIGIIQFSRATSIEVELTTFNSTYEFDLMVGGIWQLGGGTYTANAMKKAHELLTEEKETDSDYQNFMILLTDGASSQPRSALQQEADRLLNAGVNSLAVGVANARHEELLIIANGAEDRVYNTDFNKLHKIVGELQAEVRKTLEITCDPSIAAPTNGVVSCTDTNHYRSVCTYTCNEGYLLSNDSLATTTCNDDDDRDAEGEWSSVPPQCIKFCGSSDPMRYSRCNDRGTCSSSPQSPGFTCTCNAAYFGPTCNKVHCIDSSPCQNGGKCTRSTSQPGYQCECVNGYSGDTCTNEITCNPSRTAPTNGRVSCTDTNHYGSVCTYTCNEGYVLSNENLETTTCIDDGQWSSAPPQCIEFCGSSDPMRYSRCNDRGTCSSSPESPGFTCTCNAAYFGPTCNEVHCIDTSPCQNGGKCTRSTSQPGYQCECVNGYSGDTCTNEITCDPSRTAPTNGRVSCTDTNHYGSVCTYTCNEGYLLSNYNLETTTCIGEGVWSSAPPQCIEDPCTDITYQCQRWATIGYCTEPRYKRYKGFMFLFCCKSCNEVESIFR